MTAREVTRLAKLMAWAQASTNDHGTLCLGPLLSPDAWWRQRVSSVEQRRWRQAARTAVKMMGPR